MPTPIRIQPHAVSRTIRRAYRARAEAGRARREHDRARAEAGRARREHDLAIETDPRFELEHRVQVAHSIDSGRGGCPYCD
jgi:hypothetical protein